jgi:hypothetical protein
MVFPIRIVSQILTCHNKLLIVSLVEEQDSEEPLLSDRHSAAECCSTDRQSAVTVPRLFSSPELCRPLLTIVFAMVSAQISGINAGKRDDFLHDVTFLNIP